MINSIDDLRSAIFQDHSRKMKSYKRDNKFNVRAENVAGFVIFIGIASIIGIAIGVIEFFVDGANSRF